MLGITVYKPRTCYRKTLALQAYTTSENNSYTSHFSI